MFTATQPSFRTMATSFAASALITTLAIAGSASPAHADTFVGNVERQIAARGFDTNHVGVATVAVRIDAGGKLLSADVAKSSGHADLDRDALNTAHTLAFPKGTGPRTVALVLSYNRAAVPAKTDSAWLVSRYVNAKGEALAARDRLQSPAPDAG